MDEQDVRAWFGNRGVALDEAAKLEFKTVSIGDAGWLFITDNCFDYDGHDEVEAYYLKSDYAEAYDGWPRKDFSWDDSNLVDHLSVALQIVEVGA